MYIFESYEKDMEINATIRGYESRGVPWEFRQMFGGYLPVPKSLDGPVSDDKKELSDKVK